MIARSLQQIHVNQLDVWVVGLRDALVEIFDVQILNGGSDLQRRIQRLRYSAGRRSDGRLTHLQRGRGR